MLGKILSCNGKCAMSLILLSFLIVACETKSPKANEALLQAAKDGDIKTAKRLLDDGACVNGKDKAMCTASGQATLWNHPDIVELLLDHGADINGTTGFSGWTALMQASNKGFTDVVELLLDHGADVNAKSIHAWTALMMAAYGGRVEITEMLLSHGADMNAKSEKGLTALMWAEKNGQQGMSELLKEHGAE